MHNKKKQLTVMIFLIISLLVIILIGIVQDNQLKKKNAKEYGEWSKNEEEEKERIKNLNVYEKLKEGQAIKILNIGDSIGEESGKNTANGGWLDKLEIYLETTYRSEISISNITKGSTIAYRGYNELMQSNFDDYDLVFLCFGQNDQIIEVQQFQATYEAIIQEVKKRNSNSEVIPIIESSLRNYNGYSESIVKLSDYYGFNYADTIKGFNDSGIEYSNLADDGIHPNDRGYDIYFNEIKKIIDTNIENNKVSNTSIKEPLYTDTKKLQDYKFIKVKDMIENEDSYTVTTSGSFIGLSYLSQPNGGKIKIYINDVFIKDVDTSLPFEATKADIISDNLSGENTISFKISDNAKILGLITNQK